LLDYTLSDSEGYNSPDPDTQYGNDPAGQSEKLDPDASPEETIVRKEDDEDEEEEKK
jgi:hypothetical protein